MDDSKSFIIRTEDLRTEEIRQIFVPTTRDLQLIGLLKSATPCIIEGSRGTGKSLLLRVCELEQLEDFPRSRVLPLYLSFWKSSLLITKNEQQFQHWMLAKLCGRLLRILYQQGMLAQPPLAVRILAGGGPANLDEETPLEKVATAYEESYKNPGISVDNGAIPDLEIFRDAIQDICESLDISRINVLFDEAAHIFRPEQQRQFFTLFRDLRSPYMTCNAAVYPGVTSYGPSFEAIHDAQIESLNRDIGHENYLQYMREVVFRQATAEQQLLIEKNGENFDALAFAVAGNPRLLLKTVAQAGKLRSADTQATLKEFYRTSIWSEHSMLAERYPGHKELIDWGRSFVEQQVIPDTLSKNEIWKNDGKSERTAFFWIHRDSPEVVKESLRLLSYTGVVTRLDAGVVATRGETGTRYAINIGCLAAPTPNPVTYISDLRKGLSIKKFSEYGQNFGAFRSLADRIGKMVDPDVSTALELMMNKPISVLDLTDHQKDALLSIEIDTIGKALACRESDFQKAMYIGPKRSRRIMNVVTAAILEYLSG